MNKLTLNVMAFAVGFALSGGAWAEAMNKADYQSGKDRISATLKTDKAACARLTGNANAVCKAEAEAAGSIARAELEDGYKPTSKTRYAAALAKAEGTYNIAHQRCNGSAAGTRDVCLKEAKAAEIFAKANATAEMKIADANEKAKGKSSDARDNARETITDARREAMNEKLDAQYAVEVEKCGMYAAGTARNTCLEQAKTRFGVKR